jgi:hypothetical protein
MNVAARRASGSRAVLEKPKLLGSRTRHDARITTGIHRVDRAPLETLAADRP